MLPVTGPRYCGPNAHSTYSIPAARQPLWAPPTIRALKQVTTSPEATQAQFRCLNPTLIVAIATIAKPTDWTDGTSKNPGEQQNEDSPELTVLEANPQNQQQTQDRRAQNSHIKDRHRPINAKRKLGRMTPRAADAHQCP